MVRRIYCTLSTRNTVAEPQEQDISITEDSDLGEISESGSSTDDDNSEASDSNEEPDVDDDPQMDIIPDLTSHVGHSETVATQREEQSAPSGSSLPPDVCESGFSLTLC